MRLPRHRPLLPAIVICATVAFGCAKSEPPPTAAETKTVNATTATSPTTSTPPTESPAAIAVDKVRLTKVDRAEFDKVVARHKGKTVLVDFWATWCGPCVKQFPHTVELSHKYADKGLVVISVSFDDLDDEAEVRKFLAEHGATFENLLTKVDAQQAIDDFKIDNGTIPNYWVYDRSGKIARRISPSDPTAKFRIEDIDAAVEELLAQKPQ